MRTSRSIIFAIMFALLAAFAAKATTDTLPQAETFEFQAEVNRLMDIIINALYSNKDIFLRELISNASDALDKIRFLSLTDKSVLGEGDDAKLDIHISADKEKGTLTIRDKGIGMTKDELISNLGTVARSGTSKFLEAATTGGDALSLIGQFGVGFYSAYLVADSVTVTTKRSNDSQYIWESTAENTFTVYPDPSGDTLGHHGTAITLHLKEDSKDYLQDSNLKTIIERYSEFIDFPIYLHTSKVVTEEVPVDDEISEDQTDEKDETTGEESEDTTSDDDNLEVEDVPEKPKTKTVEKTVFEWKQVNSHKPIWTRSKESVSESEYKEFYKALSKGSDEPMIWTHFKAEGGVDFNALLYVPKTAPYDLYDKYYQKSSSLKLYVRRVLIADEFEDFIPRYLNFIKGVVDSDDLPINVSRETLQKNKILQVIGKRLVRNVLKMLEDLAKKPSDDDTDKEANAEASDDSVSEEKSTFGADVTYEKFWEQFGRSIKLGVLEDSKNKAKLIKLLRFPSSKSEDKLTSFEEYVERMKDEQSSIYYISGESLESVKKSPMLEELKERDLEVLYFVDPLDEYLTQSMTEFDGNNLVSVTKEGLDLGTDEKEELEKLEKEFSPLTDWLKSTLPSKSVEKVKVSNRLRSSPAVVVTSQYGWSANMERIMKAQALGDPSNARYNSPKKTLEINPKHPLIVELKRKVEENSSDSELKNIAELIFDTALLNSGFVHDDPLRMVNRVHRVLSKSMGVEFNEIEPEVKADDDVESKAPEIPEFESHDEL